MTLPVDDDGPCSCRCHLGETLFHVVWRPCCKEPIQGGKQMSVWALPKRDPHYMIIGRDENHATENYERLING